MKSEKNPQELLNELCKRDVRYPFEAYEFVYAALGYVQDQMVKAGLPKDKPKHVTGQQLSEACRDFALEQFGLMAGAVLRNWNIHKTDDIGELVYNLIGIELMSKTDTDRREDFNNVYDMKAAFSKGFQFSFN
jgi:uncharacterized repeat protein (TIGR04138 family)